MHTSTDTYILNDYDIVVDENGFFSTMVKEKTTKMEIMAINIHTLDATVLDESTFNITI